MAQHPSIYAMLLLFSVFFHGCATSKALQDSELNIMWPALPDEPKIVYLRSYQGESDFRENSFFDLFFGAPPLLGFAKPYGVFAQNDKVYVTLTAIPGIAIIDTKERKVRYIGDGGVERLSMPIGAAVSSEGTVFVSDGQLRRVYGYDANGKLKLVMGRNGEFQNPSGIAINKELGRLYIADSKGHAVHVYNLKGEALFKFGSRGEKDGQFNYPTNIAIDRRNNNVCVVDTQNFRVQTFDKDGQFLNKFGGVGDTAGKFTRPKGIGVDSEGNVYVVDAAFGNFQVFDDKGNLLLIVGNGGTEPGGFSLPAGMYIDERDRVFVVDSLNSRVQSFQFLSDNWKKQNPEQYKKYLSSATGDK